MSFFIKIITLILFLNTLNLPFLRIHTALTLSSLAKSSFFIIINLFSAWNFIINGIVRRLIFWFEKVCITFAHNFMCSVALLPASVCIIDIQIMFFNRKNYDRQTNVTTVSLESKIEQQPPSNWHAIINLELNMPHDWNTSVNFASCLVNRKKRKKKQSTKNVFTIGKCSENYIIFFFDWN